MRVFVVLAFLLVPIAEIAVLIQVGQAIGPWWTVLLLIAMSVLGTWLVRREWRQTWQALTGAFGTGRLPSSELMDAALVVIGGTLLLAPGFLTDIVGFLLLLPITRPLARRMLGAFLAQRVAVQAAGFAGRYGGTPGPVIQGEVLREDERYDPRRRPDADQLG